MASHKSTVRIRAPKLIGRRDDWINTGSRTLQIYPGVAAAWLIDFWDYTCVNCIRTLPYLRNWHERYAPLGLIIIGIHTPEFRFAARRENVERAAKEFDLRYPILLDNEYENWEAFANRYWPRKYLIDRNGYIIYDHAGEGAYGDTEEAIQDVIRMSRPDVALPDLMEPVRGEDRPGAVCYPTTPELYAGFRRGEVGNVEGYQPNSVVEYADPGSYYDGLIYAHGPWFNGAEYLRHARLTATAEDYLVIRYHAREVNVVMRSWTGEPLDVEVTQDGKPVDPVDRGEDMQYRDSTSFVHVDQPRMYQIIRNREFGVHTLKLASASDLFELYAFTFGSCEEAR